MLYNTSQHSRFANGRLGPSTVVRSGRDTSVLPNHSGVIPLEMGFSLKFESHRATAFSIASCPAVSAAPWPGFGEPEPRRAAAAARPADLRWPARLFCLLILE